LIHTKAASVDFAFFESPDISTVSAGQQPGQHADAESAPEYRRAGPKRRTFISIGAILLRYSLWLPVLLCQQWTGVFRLAAAQPRYHEWWKETTSNGAGQITSMGADVARRRAEMRIYDLAEYFIEKHRKILTQMRRERSP